MASESITQPQPQPKLVDLYNTIEDKFKSTAFGPDKWYILLLASIVGGGQPLTAKDLYLHLISQKDCQDPPSRQRLIRRLRETLVKSIAIVGVPKPIEAILSINAVEQAQDKDHTFTREHWKSGPENIQNGYDWMGKVYSRNLEAQRAIFKDHLDFRWLSDEITYGLYLSDRQVLDDIETELVVLGGIMIQNLPSETWWHIRGSRRVGMSKADVQVVWDCIQLVATFCGLKLDRVPTVGEVESDV